MLTVEELTEFIQEVSGTPPSDSPPLSPPSLMLSSTTSEPSSSSSTILRSRSPPRTPERGRNRYAQLSKDPNRVPLHRRGTSRTYERLEDLLREAGYKETRVLTPETERREAEAEERRERALQGKTGIVGFLTGLVQSVGSGKPDVGTQNSVIDDTESIQPQTVLDYSPPTSPLVRKNATTSPLRHSHLPGEPALIPSSSSQSASGYASSASSSKESSRARRTVTQQHAQARLQQHLRRDQRSVRPQPSVPSNMQTYSQASPARAYLRHMSSAPTMPRRTMTPQHGSAPHGRNVHTPNGEDTNEDQPPMPPSWLEVVARAVLGVPGAYIGGPSRMASSQFARYPVSQPPSRSSTVHGRGKRSGSALSENTMNRPRGHQSGSIHSGYLQPPSLLMCATRGETSPGTVMKTKVVCRSAPASRSSSRLGTRSGPSGPMLHENGSVRWKGKGKKLIRKNPRREPGRRSHGAFSLSTRVEEDIWNEHRPDLGGDGEYDSSSSDEDEGEINLARLLVPSKRQQSIQSLRRHLDTSHSNAGANRRPPPGPWSPEDDDDESSGLLRRSRRGSLNDGDWGTMTSFDRVGSRRRRELPRNWNANGVGR